MELKLKLGVLIPRRQTPNHDFKIPPPPDAQHGADENWRGRHFSACRGPTFLQRQNIRPKAGRAQYARPAAAGGRQDLAPRPPRASAFESDTASARHLPHSTGPRSEPARAAAPFPRANHKTAGNRPAP